MNIRTLINQCILNEDFDRSSYLRWKRKNVTLRGIKDIYAGENNAGARFGSGLYSAALSNIAMAKSYGKVYFLVNAIPKNPKIVTDTNQAEMVIQNLINNWCKQQGIEYNPDLFYKKTNIADEMLKNGYDGLIIRGREMVNYKPGNILYFETERQLENYYDAVVNS
jgi:hypothetical protein